MSRPLDPYDIDITETEKRIALRNVLDDLGLKSDWADRVLTAIQEAEAPHRRSSAKLTKVAGGTALAVGAAAAVAAPFLIIPFAAAGTAGAAALTSGLAGVGALLNGGMGAGIFALTSLAAGGGLAAAAGTAMLVSGADGTEDALQFSTSARLIAQSSPEELRATVVQVQALASLRDRLELNDHVHSEWFLLANIQAEVAESVSRVSLLSDKGSRVVEQWEQKQETMDVALAWMRDQLLAPPELAADGTVSTPPPSPSITSRLSDRVRKGRHG